MALQRPLVTLATTGLDHHLPHLPHLPYLRLPDPHLARRKTERAALTTGEHVGFNGRLAVIITKTVGSMWCAYAFAAIALISLPDAIHQGTVAVVSWISQTFLQLVLLSVIMVGQQVLAKASDKQALQTFKDTEAVLELTDQIHRLIELNNKLTDDIHLVVAEPPAPATSAPT
jgi:hypothetical protein